MTTLVYLSGSREIGQIVDTETIFPIIGKVVVLINTNETINSERTDPFSLYFSDTIKLKR